MMVSRKQCVTCTACNCFVEIRHKERFYLLPLSDELKKELEKTQEDYNLVGISTEYSY